MPEDEAASAQQRPDAERGEPDVPEGVAATEWYETDEGVVFYDAERPLAWIQAGASLDLSEMA